MKIINKNIKKIKEIFEKLKIEKKRIVLCHGVFDVLHLGHIKHFEYAKKFGDILVVSVTSDRYVNKGIGRPHFSLEHRMLTISSLSIVDFVVPSDYPTAIKNVELIKPNFYVKGPDYKNSKDITDNLNKERKAVLKCGGRIVYTTGITFSSSSIINKIDNKFNNDQNLFLKQIKNKYSFIYIEKVINKISNLSVNIFGEIIIDQYISCEPIGISGKDPFLVFNKKAEKRYPGGSFAIAKNVSDFSKKTNLISIFSKKIIKDYLTKNKNKNLFLDLVFNKKGTDILKNRYLDINTNTKLFGLYSLNQDQISNVLEKKILKLLINRKKNNYFIISDYGHGLISKKISDFISKNRFNYTINSQINSSNRGFHSLFKYQNPKAVVINQSELVYEFKDKISSTEELIIKLQKSLNAEVVVVTTGISGAISYSKKEGFNYCPAFSEKILDKVGAGDALLSIFSLCKFVGLQNDLSLFISSLSAGYQVSVVNNSSFLKKNQLLKQINHILK